MSFERPTDLTMLIFSCLIELVSVSSNCLRSFPKHPIFHRSFSLTFSEFEKCIPKAKTESLGHLTLNGVSSLSFHFPNHIASDFVQLFFNPKHLSNFSRRSSKTHIDSGSFRKTVVSTAYCVIFISRAPTLMPSIFGFILIASARISIPSTKSVPDSEQPCLTPRSRLKKSEAKPLFVTQLVMLQ